MSSNSSSSHSDHLSREDADCRFSGRYLSLMERNGWEFASRISSPEVVAIIAVTDEEEILLVEQYREPVKASVIELPAGLIGDQAGQEDETAETAARRELLEESGYSAGRWQDWGRAPTSAGLSNEVVRFFFADTLVRKHAGGGDDSEDITVHRIPLKQAGRWLSERSQLIDPKVFTALYWLENPDSRPA